MNGELDTCHCCEGLTSQTPAAVTNRPGISAIAYRVGTHSQFKQSMLAALSDVTRPALQNLKTRDDDDFSISLLDAAATIADVLTFYQERIANESYLRTATERRSLLELARLIGYELRPGVAASAFLAFTMDETPGAPSKTTVDIGTKVQSVPGPNEKPQTFETSADITAYAAWNAITPLLSKTQNLVNGVGELYLTGTDTGLKVGDVVMVTSTVYNGAAHVLKIEVDYTKKLTHATFDNAIPSLGGVPGAIGIMVWGDQKIPFNSTTILQEILLKTWKDSDLRAFLETNEWDPETLMDYVSQYHANNPSTVGYAYALRTRIGIFGNNAPKYETLPASQRFGEWVEKKDQSWEFEDPPYGSSWEGRDITTDSKGGNKDDSGFYLDRSVPAAQPGGYVVLENSTGLSVYPITGVAETSLSDYGMSAKITKLSVSVSPDTPVLNKFSVRGTTAYVQSEPLALAELPLTTQLVQGATDLDLNGFFLGLTVGQPVILTGERDDADSLTQSEVLFIKEINHNCGLTNLTFETGLTHPYKRDTVTINANVAPSTHGETVSEILGSGDASHSYQRFTLKQSPLTYVSAATASGARSTLETKTEAGQIQYGVRVNDLLWHEAPTLFGRGPQERVYVTRTGDDGKTTIEFGDGGTGARLPSGQDNMRGTYRKGIGTDGLVKAGQLTSLLTRPLGIKSVVNPEDATGAQDRESLADARTNAPLTVLTLDRTVSLQDYEDFSRAFAGVAKALATWIWDGQTRRVFITVAGPDGAEIKPDSDTYMNLLSALQQAGDPFVSLRVKSYQPTHFRFAGKVKANPDYETDVVLAGVEHALRQQFSFEVRAFGQPVFLSEVIATVQAAPGVLAVDVNKLYPADAAVATLKTPLPAALPETLADGSLAAADLLTLDPAPLDELGVMS
jgi:hypothetical protein